MMASAGPEPVRDYSKDSKEVAVPPPPVCDWSGFYIGLHVGGQFGTSETLDIDGYNGEDGLRFGYDESGVVAGGQAGYNFQWGRFVLGPEFDIGYMDLDGRGLEPFNMFDDTFGESNSDLYFTLRGRAGLSVDWHGCWLLYATGGAIGVNYETRFIDDSITPPAGPGLIDVHEQEINWGYTVGGGVERQINRHWSVKVEYLYFNLCDQSFEGDATLFPIGVAGGAQSSGPQTNGPGIVNTFHDHFAADTDGHIVRAGLNFHF